MEKNLLITGGAGFVGSNLALFLKKKLPDFKIICFDNLFRQGSELNVSRLEDNGIVFIKGDIRNKEELLNLKDIHLIVECSAEPSVLAAYEDPNYVVDTNLGGTVNCLELARRDKSDFIFLSTSRVYPIDALEAIPSCELTSRLDWSKDACGTGYGYDGITHEFPLAGVRSLYGATKLCSENIALEYFDMFGIRGVINRLGVISGPWQMARVDQGLVGFWVAQHKYKKDLSYIGFGGSGKQLRDVVHVDDVCELICHEINHMDDVNGKTFNAGGGRTNSFSLLELTNITQEITKEKIPIGSVPETRKSDISIYISDNSYVHELTGWLPKKSVEDIVCDVNSWINQNDKILEKVLN